MDGQVLKRNEKIHENDNSNKMKFMWKMGLFSVCNS